MASISNRLPGIAEDLTKNVSPRRRLFLALGYVAFQVGDALIFTASLITAGAVLGFFVWNFPAGLIFLGDG